MAWVRVLEQVEQMAWLAGVADHLAGLPSMADSVGEELRAFYVAGFTGEGL